MSVEDGLLRILSRPSEASLKESLAAGRAVDIDRIVEDAIRNLERAIRFGDRREAVRDALTKRLEGIRQRTALKR